MSPSLLILLLLPTAGAVVGSMLPSGKAARWWALVVSLATFAVSLVMAANFPWKNPTPHTLPAFEPEGFQFAQVGLGLRLGVDAVGMWLVLLTTFLTPLAILASFESITDRTKEYYAWMLALLTAMLGVFLSRDLLLFYVFFELTLVPMFFIIGIWGGPDRRFAAGKFFLFTFAGSVFTLAAAVYLGTKYGTFDIDRLVALSRAGGGTVAALNTTERFWILLGLLAGFSVKVPLFPVHTWLPLAHTEAPTAGSVILAGVLLKLGTFGLYKLAVPLGMLDGSGHPVFLGTLRVVAALCVVGVIYGALVAWVQQDVKKLVAYSSVSHLGFCVLGLLALNVIGVQGSVLYMINHGLSTGALFLCIGMFYDRYHTRDINEISGLARRMPVLAFFMVVFAMSSIGLPGTNGFVSEFLTILGAFTSSNLGIAYGAFAALGIILGAVYMLHMLARVLFGPLKLPDLHRDPAHSQADQGQGASPGHDHHGHADRNAPGDLNVREIGILIPLALAVIVFGVRPNLVLNTIRGPVQDMLGNSAAAPVAQQIETPRAMVAVDTGAAALPR